ncbi:MAG: EAL domain-containing protein [Candidatus Competibacter sp.]|nr:EAL domain-containing protein [Candidatus Competibacter sp.]
MTQDQHDDIKILREKAEASVAQCHREMMELSREESHKLVHELQVHQIELEMQNEELRRIMGELEHSRNQFSLLFHQAPIGYLVLNDLGLIHEVNETFCRMVSRDRNRLVGSPLAECLEGDDRGVFLARYRAFFKNPAGKNLEAPILRDREPAFHAYMEGAILNTPPRHRQENNPTLLLLAITDITQRKLAEQALKESETRLNLAIHGARIGLWDWMVQSGKTVFNDKWAELIGFTLDELSQTGMESWLELLHPEDMQQSSEILERHFRGELEYYELEARLRHKNGDWVWVLVRGKVTEWQDRKPVRMIGTHIDITQHKRAENRIRYLAHHDPLTDLPNRALLAERAAMALALASRHQNTLAILFFDLDGFKDINDSLGHEAGDVLLKQVAARLKAILREVDTLARLGGDEFIVLLPDVGRNGAAQVADKTLTLLREPVELGGHRLAVTSSIGISLYPHDGASFETLLKNADTAMYRAKHEGRNRFKFYDTRMNAEILDRLTLLAALRKGIQTGQLRTHFQPKARLADGAVVGAEALVRWHHPEQGLLLPDRFIPMAKETDLIVAIGEWVLDDVCRHLTAWRDAGLPELTVAVNLAARHFREPRLVDHLATLLARHDLPPARVELELTESTLLDVGRETQVVIESLRKIGFHLVIDDFGAGYSSLVYLKNLPFSSLKIDQSLVHDLENDANDRAITEAMVALSHIMGLAVVAEGVETERQRQILLEQGCEFVQGNLLSPPLPAEAFVEWLVDRGGESGGARLPPGSTRP